MNPHPTNRPQVIPIQMGDLSDQHDLNCEQFASRMNRLLDQRVSLEGDDRLDRHAAICGDCRGRLESWIAIARLLDAPEVVGDPEVSVLSPPSIASRAGQAEPTRLSGVRPLLAAAAAVLLAVGGWYAGRPIEVAAIATGPAKSEASPSNSAVPTGAATSEITTSELAVSGLAYGEGLAGDRWWARLSEASWLDQTMPTVRRVGEGVAPLGRSLLQAVSILTTASSPPA
ncbi:MAG: hypothetical protein AAGA03_05830 [Planctomycetota bacterium]